MALTLPVAARNAAADAIATLINAGPSFGTLELRTTPRPAPDAAATGTLLGTFTLADPAFTAAVSGVSTLDTSPVLTATGVGAGAAAWFRLLDSTGASVLDGSVTASGGGGDLIVNTTTVSVGLALEITAGTITMPAS